MSHRSGSRGGSSGEEPCCFVGCDGAGVDCEVGVVQRQQIHRATPTYEMRHADGGEIRATPAASNSTSPACSSVS